jgi:uncharacterized membrane protein
MGADAGAVAPSVARAVHTRGRVESIDLLRGLIIIVMALDHTRDFFGNFSANPTDLATTSVALFLTRWITHLCAPVFFLLTGVGAYLSRGRLSQAALSRWLITRGLWLIFLELVVMRFALQFNFDYHVTIITVLWALGWAMIVLAALIWLPLWAIAAFGIVLIGGHNLFDTAAMGGAINPAWTVLHQPGVLLRTDHSLVRVSYVLIPWVGVTAIGYVLGAAYQLPAGKRQRLLLWMAIGLTVGFVLLRLTNVYGDPVPWTHQHSAVWTLLSFVNTTKYPPSLLFLLMTLGPALGLLWAFDAAAVPRMLRPALTIGSVPLFFYIAHFYLIHLLATAVSYWRFGIVRETFQSPDLRHFPFAAPPGWDVGLPLIYLIWISVVILLYPLCRWYANLKRRRQDWWLSYL